MEPLWWIHENKELCGCYCCCCDMSAYAQTGHYTHMWLAWLFLKAILPFTMKRKIMMLVLKNSTLRSIQNKSVFYSSVQLKLMLRGDGKTTYIVYLSNCTDTYLRRKTQVKVEILAQLLSKSKIKVRAFYCHEWGISYSLNLLLPSFVLPGSCSFTSHVFFLIFLHCVANCRCWK